MFFIPDEKELWLLWQLIFYIMVKIDNFFCLSGDIWNLFSQKCLLSSSLRFIWLLSKSLNLVTRATKKVNFRKKNVKTIFSESIRWMKLILFRHAYGIFFYIYFCFCQLRTMVAMELFSLLWLYLANSQVSVYRTIGPLVSFCYSPGLPYSLLTTAMYSFIMKFVCTATSNANIASINAMRCGLFRSLLF